MYTVSGGSKRYFFLLSLQTFSSLLRALEYTSAFVRVIHEEEMWLYKNPKSKNTISTEMLFVGYCFMFLSS